MDKKITYGQPYMFERQKSTIACVLWVYSTGENNHETKKETMAMFF